MRSSIIFTNEDTKQFATNTRRGTDYKATIQNLSGQSITITVTNQNIQDPNPVFDEPAEAPLVIVDGAIGVLNDPYDGWLITAAVATTGTVEIVEAG